MCKNKKKRKNYPWRSRLNNSSLSLLLKSLSVSGNDITAACSSTADDAYIYKIMGKLRKFWQMKKKTDTYKVKVIKNS